MKKDDALQSSKTSQRRPTEVNTQPRGQTESEGRKADGLDTQRKIQWIFSARFKILDIVLKSKWMLFYLGNYEGKSLVRNNWKFRSYNESLSEST